MKPQSLGGTGAGEGAGKIASARPAVAVRVTSFFQM